MGLRRFLGSKGKADRLAALATRPDQREAFLRVLIDQGVVVLASMPDPAGHVSFLDYTDGRGSAFPIFSSVDRAVEHIKTIPHEKITPYQQLTVTVAFLLENDWSKRRLIFNPRSASETEITTGDLQALARLAKDGRLR